MTCTTHVCPFREGECPGPAVDPFASLEQELRDAAFGVAVAESSLAEEYLLLMSGGKYQTWQAQKMAEFKRGDELRRAQAHYEIALARLKRA